MRYLGGGFLLCSQGLDGRYLAISMFEVMGGRIREFCLGQEVRVACIFLVIFLKRLSGFGRDLAKTGFNFSFTNTRTLLFIWRNVPGCEIEVDQYIQEFIMKKRLSNQFQNHEKIII